MKGFNKARGVYESALTEEHVLKEIVQRLWLNKIKVWRIVERIPWGRKKSTPGIPDLIGHARFDLPENPGTSRIPVYIEVKKPGGAHRPAQVAFIAEAREDGCIACFASSWEEVVAEFNRHGITLEI